MTRRKTKRDGDPVSKAGRPQEPIPADKAEAVLDWLYDGKSLLSFCQIPGNPKNRTVYEWQVRDPAFGAAFARARAAGAGVLVDQAQHVADDRSNDWATDEDGVEQLNREHVQRSKLRVETLLKRAACFAPAVYGTKVQLGGDASAPPIKVETKDAGPPVPPIADLRKWAASLATSLADGDGDGDGSDSPG